MNKENFNLVCGILHTKKPPNKRDVKKDHSGDQRLAS